jgi:REP element-mobilizing transposase RayT
MGEISKKVAKYRKKMLEGKITKHIRKTFRKIAEEYGWEIDEMSVQEYHI